MKLSILIIHMGDAKPTEKKERREGRELHDNLDRILSELRITPDIKLRRHIAPENNAPDSLWQFCDGHFDGDISKVNLRDKFSREDIFEQTWPVDNVDLLFLHKTNCGAEDFFLKVDEVKSGLPIVVVSNVESPPDWLAGPFLSLADERNYSISLRRTFEFWKEELFRPEAFAESFAKGTDRQLINSASVAIDELASVDLVLQAYLAAHSQDHKWPEWRCLPVVKKPEILPANIKWEAHEGDQLAEDWFNILLQQLVSVKRLVFDPKFNKKLIESLGQYHLLFTVSEWIELARIYDSREFKLADQWEIWLLDPAGKPPSGGALRLVWELVDRGGNYGSLQADALDTTALCTLFHHAHCEYYRLSTFVSRCFDDQAKNVKDERWLRRLRETTNHDDLMKDVLVKMGFTQGNREESSELVRMVWSHMNGVNESRWEAALESVSSGRTNWPEAQKRLRYFFESAPGECGLDGTNQFADSKTACLAPDGWLATIDGFMRDFERLAREPDAIQRQRLQVFWTAAESLHHALSDIGSSFAEYFVISGSASREAEVAGTY